MQAVDSHWVIEPGTSYMMGYVSRYVPMSLIENIPRAVETFQGLFDAQVSVSLDLKKAIGTALPSNKSVFGNTSYNPAAHASAGLILPSVTASNYYPALPETHTTLQAVLNDASLAGRIGCAAADVKTMSTTAMRRCWTAFHADLEKTRANYYANTSGPIKKAFPPAGYWNEADWFEEDWQSVFWGDNYPRLLVVKRAVDPKGLFVCHHCVGSEGWTADGNCLLG